MSVKEFIYSDRCTISLSSEGELRIELPNETLQFNEQGKPAFHNGNGESVIEYSGLVTDGNKARSFAKAMYEPNGYSELHYHKERTENYYIVEGEAKVTLGDDLYQLSAGDRITIPRGVHHQVHNITPNGSLVLIVKCEPAWIVEDFRLVAKPELKSKPELKPEPESSFAPRP